MVAMAGTVLATSDYKITKVQVNNEIVTSTNTLQVDLGSKINVQVWMEGTSSTEKDVKLRAWIGGYEYGILQSVTQTFDLENGVTEYKSVTIDIPDDMKTGTHTLHVELFDDKDQVEKSYNLFVEANRHDLKIRDVMVSPGSNVEAGRTIMVRARVENMGEKKEKDIKVTASIQELGTQTSTYIDTLYPWTQDDNSISSNTLYLMIPIDAKTGDYKLKIIVKYNRGHSTVEQTKMIRVQGKKEQSKKETKDNTMVSIEDSDSNVKIGEETTYKILVANLGDTKKTYSVEVLPTSGVSTTISQSTITLSSSESGEFLLKVKANQEGTHTVSVKVKDGNDLLKQSTINVYVENKVRMTTIYGIAIVVVFIAFLIVVGLLTRKDPRKR